MNNIVGKEVRLTNFVFDKDDISVEDLKRKEEMGEKIIGELFVVDCLEEGSRMVLVNQISGERLKTSNVLHIEYTDDGMIYVTTKNSDYTLKIEG